MKRTSWACFNTLLLLLLTLGAAAAADVAQPLRPRQADVLITEDATPPPADAAWRRVDLPHAVDRSSAWYRIEFDAPTTGAGSWAVYVPHFYGGGRLLLNGMPLAQVPESSAEWRVRWERPFLLAIPDPLLRPGRNVLLLRVPVGPVSQRVMLPLVEIGPQAELIADYERRLFWVRVMPQVTVASCFIVGALVLFIWWRRREELLYGLFGIAALLWGARTLTFVIEVLPTDWWGPWRMFYHGATGGFVAVLLVFALRLAGWHRPWLERTLFVYWLLGPLGYIASGGNETLIGRVWSGGLIPIGLGVVVMSAVAAWRRRTVPLVALSAAITLAVAAGVHDYLLAASSPMLKSLLPQWTAHRIFLLHYGADLVLLVMGLILSARFVGTLQAIEQLNRTLESRVAERERALADNYSQLGRLERQHAADDERQRIMRDLHDGLGSQLFVTLSRVEAGEIQHAAIVQALRDCIADMRLALEAMSPESNDFLEAWGNFRFRWERQLEAAGLKSSWKVDAAGDTIELAPHAALQLLRIAQEALTNVLKHAGAKEVRIRLSTHEGAVRFEVSDDGKGMPSDERRPGRGLANMRARASRLGARLGIETASPGTRLWVEFEDRSGRPMPHPETVT